MSVSPVLFVIKIVKRRDIGEQQSHLLDFHQIQKFLLYEMQMQPIINQ